MTKEITQEERLDLTNVKKEKEAFAKCIEDKIKTLLKDTKGSVIIDTKDLYAENQRLKAQLDREIKINRKMKETLKKYAECEPLEIKREYFNNEPTQLNKTMADIGALAREVLKEIENKE